MTISRQFVSIGLIKALLKGYTVLYLLLLPILYTQKTISAEQIGYIGATLIVGAVTSALLLSLNPHKLDAKSLSNLSQFIVFCATLMIIINHSLPILFIAYLLTGMGIAMGSIVTDELMTQFTKRGSRFSTFANIAVFMDIMRIIYPIMIGAIFATFNTGGVFGFALFTVILSFLIINLFLDTGAGLGPIEGKSGLLKSPLQFLKHNKSFSFVLSVEFLDSLTSSQLFVFLPTLLILKNFSIESALGIQSIFFLGYLTGRILVSRLANRWDGLTAVGWAELAMGGVIILLVFLPVSPLLYLLCFLLGIFTRGTSPVIKATAFDQLETGEISQGAAIHGIGGDVGSSAGQLLFGLLLAWFGANAPFLFAAAGTVLIAIACFGYRVKVLGNYPNS